MVKILLIDRCIYSRKGMKELISKDNQFSISETDNLLVAREKIIQWQPDMVIADFSGFSYTLHSISQLSAIYSACEKSTRLMVMQSGEHPLIEQYCRKWETAESVSKAMPLKELRELTEYIIASRPPCRFRQQAIAPLLTLREERVLTLWTDATSNEMIARTMGISTKTVYTYKRNIRMKLGADNRFSLFLTPSMAAI